MERRAVEDHRAVGPGGLFVGPQGGRGHGVQHAAASVGAGAAEVLTDRQGAQLRAQGLEAPVVVVEDPRTALGQMVAVESGANVVLAAAVEISRVSSPSRH